MRQRMQLVSVVVDDVVGLFPQEIKRQLLVKVKGPFRLCYPAGPLAVTWTIMARFWESR